MGYDMYIEDRDGLTQDAVYFRLNMWAMVQSREAMARYDMLVMVNPPPWPRPEEFGCEAGRDEQGWAVYNEASPEWAAYQKVAAKVRDGHCDREEPGIPIYKLTSNDGWLVTPLEIEGALTMYGKASPVSFEQPDWWDEWLDYLKLAKDHGGFRVH